MRIQEFLRVLRYVRFNYLLVMVVICGQPCQLYGTSQNYDVENEVQHLLKDLEHSSYLPNPIENRSLNLTINQLRKKKLYSRDLKAISKRFRLRANSRLKWEKVIYFISENEELLPEDNAGEKHFSIYQGSLHQCIQNAPEKALDSLANILTFAYGAPDQFDELSPKEHQYTLVTRLIAGTMKSFDSDDFDNAVARVCLGMTGRLHRKNRCPALLELRHVCQPLIEKYLVSSHP